MATRTAACADARGWVSAVVDMLGSMSGVPDPAQLGSVFVEAVNAGDLDGVIRCYDEAAVLELPDGSTAVERSPIRQFYAALLADRTRFDPGKPAPALFYDDVVLTNTRIGPTATAEEAQRQADGRWRWILDRPDVRLDRP